MYQFVYGLPDTQFDFPSNGQANVGNWLEHHHTNLLKAVKDWEHDVLAAFLASSMLRRNPLRRLSASDCLTAVSRIRGYVAAQDPGPQLGTITEPTLSSLMPEALNVGEMVTEQNARSVSNKSAG